MTREIKESILSEDRSFKILDTAPDAMVVVARDQSIVFVNVQTEQLFGYARHDLLGLPLDVLIPERFHGAHGGHVSHYFERPTVRVMGSGLELFGRRADGTELAIEVSLSPVYTEEGVLVSAAIRDISERKRIEGEARLNAERLASAVENIQDALALYDASDRLVLCNSAFRRLLGETISGPVVGLRFADVLDGWLSDMAFETDAQRDTFRKARLADRRNPIGQFDVHTRDGRSFRATDHRTLEGGIVSTIWDLTSDVQRERDLHEARIAAEAGSAAKSDFLSSMSHELRTPLNAILGFAQLLERDKREPLSTRHKGRVREIVKGGEHLLHLIDDILDLSRIEAGGISISREPVYVLDALDAAKSALGPMAARINIRMEVVAEKGPSTVSADRTRFVQILMNFGSNAIKYNRAGGKVVFTVTESAPGFVRVAVSDTGLGIPEDKQEKLFQPFQRAGQETGSIEGTGIGLVITKRLAELMGGSVGFQSVSGRGSEFWVELPLHASTQTEPPAPAPSSSSGARLGDGNPRLVLYVEDNPANVTFMRDLLSGFDGVELISVPTAEIGVELARGRNPDFIIMDINLPGMSGLDALRALREWPETKHIPVIALTAAASERDRQRGEQAGFFRYLTKPVNVGEFEAAVEALLETLE